MGLSSGAFNTMTVEPITQSAQPIFPAVSSRSLSSTQASTELHRQNQIPQKEKKKRKNSEEKEEKNSQEPTWLPHWDHQWVSPISQGQTNTLRSWGFLQLPLKGKKWEKNYELTPKNNSNQTQSLIRIIIRELHFWQRDPYLRRCQTTRLGFADKTSSTLRCLEMGEKIVWASQLSSCQKIMPRDDTKPRPVIFQIRLDKSRKRLERSEKFVYHVLHFPKVPFSSPRSWSQWRQLRKLPE